eukprot:scaffold109014_cov54-Phaeocystis_antarctica.AAC.1
MTLRQARGQLRTGRRSRALHAGSLRLGASAGTGRVCAAACRATHPEEARPSPTVRADAQVTVADGSGLVGVGHLAVELVGDVGKLSWVARYHPGAWWIGG